MVLEEPASRSDARSTFTASDCVITTTPAHASNRYQVPSGWSREGYRSVPAAAAALVHYLFGDSA